MESETFDAIVIGAGQAGRPLALSLAGAGRRTAVIERDRVGGSCIVEGCTPSKTMLASARVAHIARNASTFGVETGGVSVDMEAVRARKRDIVDAFVRSSRSALEEADGVQLIDGDARFVGARTIEIDQAGRGRRVVGDRIFVNTGARPRVPDIDGLDAVPFLDSTAAMELDEVPAHLAVLGGGAVGLELGQMYRRFGAEVTLFEREPRILPGEDEDVSEELRRVLSAEGMKIVTDARVTHVEPTEDGVRILGRRGKEPVSVDASQVLVAVGRTPNTDGLHLSNAGIQPDERGYVPVDEQCRTEVDGIWAMGEVTGAPPFTHIAYDDYRVVSADVLEGREKRTRDRLLPYAIFTDPELGRVGPTEHDARERGLRFRVAKLAMERSARAVETDEEQGFLKALVDDETDRVIGATALAAHGGELVAILQLAMMGDVPYTEIRDGVIAHPTRAEALQRLFATLEPR